MIYSFIHWLIYSFQGNIGLILHAVGEFDLAVKFFEHALELNQKYFGKHSLKAALSYHLLARTQSCRGDFRTALQYEKETFHVYKTTLGDDHDKTRESGECLKHLTQQAVTLQKRMNEITRNSGSVQNLLPLQVLYRIYRIYLICIVFFYFDLDCRYVTGIVYCINTLYL